MTKETCCTSMPRPVGCNHLLEPERNSLMITSRSLVHVSMHGDGEVSGMHLLGEPIHLPSGVDEDDCLGNGQGFIQVAQGVTQLPLLSFHIDVELTDTLQCQLFLLDKNSIGSLMNFLVTLSTSECIVADSKPPGCCC